MKRAWLIHSIQAEMGQARYMQDPPLVWLLHCLFVCLLVHSRSLSDGRGHTPITCLVALLLVCLPICTLALLDGRWRALARTKPKKKSQLCFEQASCIQLARPAGQVREKTGYYALYDIYMYTFIRMSVRMCPCFEKKNHMFLWRHQ